jgi:hypothetical protein
MFHGWITIRPDGEVLFHGYDEPDSHVHHRTNKIVVSKTKGGSYWRGIGIERGYAGTFFRVMEVSQVNEKDERGNERMYVNTIAEFPIRSPKEK